MGAGRRHDHPSPRAAAPARAPARFAHSQDRPVIGNRIRWARRILDRRSRELGELIRNNPRLAGLLHQVLEEHGDRLPADPEYRGRIMDLAHAVVVRALERDPRFRHTWGEDEDRAVADYFDSADDGGEGEGELPHSRPWPPSGRSRRRT